ncbi:efflux RND transporter permease subunit [Rubellicoccus peritrichatus]|uniref:Efflux RND transporter permease subunit n=1 Tax=Rubellicoccus peritrichatus TaxID=3080537 RepID=A0AAQ3LCL4_9BACT|nr:efflux RND transporter permease subunit [Puniceicoccus sp. CR14]WOO43001.1 efflux RND transporter permease subunit [Puniceicoccus sp. CR14]
MNTLIQLAVRQPITICVGIILVIASGFLAFSGVPVRMAPEVDSVIISVSTFWENASPAEIESDVIEEQEAVLGDLSGLEAMTSISQAGSGQLRLQFKTGTDINAAMAEVDQKLSEVPGYPLAVNEPTIEGYDPESVDYIAWIGLASTDPEFDATTLYDFMERRVRPRFERLRGVSRVGVLGAREAEVQILVDPVELALRGITYAELVDAIQLTNDNFSGGSISEGKNDIRVRAIGRFHDVDLVKQMVIRRDESGPVYLGDVAEVIETHKEMVEWVRARGHLMPFFNFQLESGANQLETMALIQEEMELMNEPGGLLDQHAKRLGLNGTLELVQTYDSSTYVVDAIALVKSNIVFGGILAVSTLLLFLRSVRTVGIIGIAIPISVLASIVVLIAMGRSINIISLAGMAFAVGMVVDNAIVVIENIFRHLEMGKSVRRASIEGTQEVARAVFASTITTMVVFIPILLIQDSAGQLFRDIALAIMAAVGLSLIVSITVIPAAAAKILKPKDVLESLDGSRGFPKLCGAHWKPIHWLGLGLKGFFTMAKNLPDTISKLIYRLTGSAGKSAIVVAAFTILTLGGIWLLMPPMDYLPKGNRNIIFSAVIPPPGYGISQLSEIGHRIEGKVSPSWEISGDKFQVEEVVRGSDDSTVEDRREPIPMGDGSGETLLPPMLEHYFLVAWDGRMFQVGIFSDKKRVVDGIPFFNDALSGSIAPDVFGFSFQFPLFTTGGQSGSAIKIDLIGDDLEMVSNSAGALLFSLMESFGPFAVTPEPANFLLPAPELRFIPDDERLRELGMSRRDVGYAVQANGDGLILVRQFELGSELKDLKIISPDAIGDNPVDALLGIPLATADGQIVDLGSVASIERVREPEQIKHVDRQRAVTLQFTPPPGLPLETAIATVDEKVAALREAGAIPQEVEVNQAGSAGKLAEIKNALLGDGSFGGLLASSLFLAFVVIYLVMVVLFQSWTYPLVIMLTVPLATFGGFLGLYLIHVWSLADRYMPVQNLDVLTILGFVILAGVVVNNAILIVHQALNFFHHGDDGHRLTAREAISRSVKTRVRPIMMSTLTSVGGMLPLVFLPGSGSELYRGLGAVVVGGLLVSTIFTLILVPIVLSFILRDEHHEGEDKDEAASVDVAPQSDANTPSEPVLAH